MISFLRKKKRVLVLDDDVSIRKLVKKILKSKGFEVEIVGSGREAIEKLGGGSFDAVLLDLMMPHEGGLTVLRHLEQNDPQALRRAIVMTASTGSVLVNWREKIFAVIQKPFEIDAFAKTVADCAATARPVDG